MTRRQMILILGLNAIISLVISLAVVGLAGLMTPREAPSTGVPRGIAPTPSPKERTALIQPTSEAKEPLSVLSTSGPMIHIVKAGDTISYLSQKYDVPMEAIIEANQLADPNTLAVGQELIIPLAEPTPLPESSLLVSPTPAPTHGPTPGAPTSTPTIEPYALVIKEIVAPGRQEAEVLVLSNFGRDVRLQGWTLSNGRGQIYTFPNLTLFRDNSIRIWTIEGRNTPSDLYWGLKSAAWGPGVETATLKDQYGKVQATYTLR